MKTDRIAAITGASAAAIVALALLLGTAVFGAEPAAETAKTAATSETGSQVQPAATPESATVATGSEVKTHHNPFLSEAMTSGQTTGGIDPHGDSWQSIRHSFQQFAHPEFMLRLFFNLALAVGCAWVIAWHPRRSARVDPLSDFEERKAFIILGVVGAIVAELSGTNPTLAFVIFGIGALLRFRTVLDNPKATGKAILVVVIGLACGMGSWTMAVFVTAFSWGLLFWLDSHVACSLTIRLGEGDVRPLQNIVQSLLLSHRCRLQSSTLSKGNKRLEFLFHMPAGLDQDNLEADVRAKLPKSGDPRISVKVG